jgi:DNA repair exonuclease SbcCD ATPase subunit
MINPFALPGNDPDLYHQREIERVEEEKYRQAIKYYPIQERHVFAQGRSILPDLKKEPSETDGHLPNIGSRRALSSKKETIKEFIQRKREILLVKKAIENKKAKYNELEEDLIKKEDKHKANIKKLEDNKGRVAKYEEQLKLEADSKAKLAEAKAGERTEKQKELKNLQDEIESLKGKVDRKRDELEVLKDFKRFIEELVPTDNKSGVFLTESFETLKSFAKRLEESINSLEATNLFKILQKQDDEHEIELLRRKNNTATTQNTKELSELKTTVQSLENNKKVLEDKLRKISLSEEIEAPVDEVSSKKVHNELVLLFQECGGDLTNNPKELEMLETIEKVFDSELKEKEEKGKEIVKKLERDIDKERRQKKIEDERIKNMKKTELFNKKLEERKQKVAKKVGRKEMKKMKLHKKEKIEKPPDEPQEVLDRREFLETEN